MFLTYSPCITGEESGLTFDNRFDSFAFALPPSAQSSRLQEQGVQSISQYQGTARGLHIVHYSIYDGIVYRSVHCSPKIAGSGYTGEYHKR